MGAANLSGRRHIVVITLRVMRKEGACPFTEGSFLPHHAERDDYTPERREPCGSLRMCFARKICQTRRESAHRGFALLAGAPHLLDLGDVVRGHGNLALRCADIDFDFADSLGRRLGIDREWGH